MTNEQMSDVHVPDQENKIQVAWSYDIISPHITLYTDKTSTQTQTKYMLLLHDFKLNFFFQLLHCFHTNKQI